MKDFISQINKKLISIYVIIFWIILWGIISFIINKEIYLPFPLKTFGALIDILIKPEFWKTVSHSILRVMTGFFLSCLFGIILGFACGMNKYLMSIFNPLIVTIRATPVMSFIIIAIIWFNSGNVPVFVAFLMCFPIIWGNVLEGVRNIDKGLIDMSKVYNISNIHVFRDIYIPSLIPYVLSGMITALGIGWKSTVAAEVLSQPKFAIGTYLYDAKVYLESTQLFAWTIVVVALSFFFEYVIKYLFVILKRSYTN